MRAIILAAALCLAPAYAYAQQLYLSGTVGNAPVLAVVERDGNAMSGWYFYLRHGKEIRLEGQIAATGAFTWNEYSPGAANEHASGASMVTATFKGTARGAQWSGTWRAAKGGAAVPFALAENRDVLAALSGRFRCSARDADRQSGWTFEQTVDLTVAQGRVAKFSAGHLAKSADGDRQECNLGLTDLARQDAQTGILLRAIGDDGTDSDGDRCSVRIISAGDYLYVRVGDASESRNSCLGVGDEARFCSPRGNWNDLILDRKTGRCTLVQ